MKRVRAIFFILFSLCFPQASMAGLEDEIAEIKKSIVRVHDTFTPRDKLKDVPFGTAGVTELKNLSYKFEKLTKNPYYETEWDSYVEKAGIYKWPKQTDKQAIGGSLFYPKDVVEWVEDTAFMNHLLQRKDILWSFAIASRYKDPRGMLYLYHALSNRAAAKV